MDIEVENLKKWEDERGFLIEFLRGKELDEQNKMFAQIYATTIKPGTIRGNHYHKEKVEWITILQGIIKITVEDVNTKERKEVIIDASKEGMVSRIKFGKNVAHVLQNISNEIVSLIAYTTKEYDPNNLDKISYKVV